MDNNSRHPYLPRDIILPGYVENDLSNVRLISTFFGIISIFLVILYKYSGHYDHLRSSFLTKIKLCWFFLCGFVHLILEGYFFVSHRTIPTSSSFLSQMWKEYSICDSRYITGDSFVVCMEGITAIIDGPLAFYAVYLFMKNRPSRFVVQLILSVCQLYGDTLYFTTEYKENFIHGPYNHPTYFWFYFFFMNLIWIIIPILCIVESYKALSKAGYYHESLSFKNE